MRAGSGGSGQNFSLTAIRVSQTLLNRLQTFKTP